MGLNNSCRTFVLFLNTQLGRFLLAPVIKLIIMIMNVRL